jgi:predicted enzyme related to lactoylglutathione lyase
VSVCSHDWSRWYGSTCYPARLSGFYRELFGWSITGVDQDYHLVDTGAGEDAIGGGIGASEPTRESGAVTVYVRVEDLQATLDAAEKLGAKTLVPPTALPEDYGHFAMFADLDGHAVGLMA